MTRNVHVGQWAQLATLLPYYTPQQFYELNFVQSQATKGRSPFSGVIMITPVYRPDFASYIAWLDEFASLCDPHPNLEIILACFFDIKPGSADYSNWSDLLAMAQNHPSIKQMGMDCEHVSYGGPFGGNDYYNLEKAWDRQDLSESELLALFEGFKAQVNAIGKSFINYYVRYGPDSWKNAHPENYHINMPTYGRPATISSDDSKAENVTGGSFGLYNEVDVNKVKPFPLDHSEYTDGPCGPSLESTKFIVDEWMSRPPENCQRIAFAMRIESETAIDGRTTTHTFDYQPFIDWVWTAIDPHLDRIIFPMGEPVIIPPDPAPARIKGLGAWIAHDDAATGGTGKQNFIANYPLFRRISVASHLIAGDGQSIVARPESALLADPEFQAYTTHIPVFPTIGMGPDNRPEGLLAIGPNRLAFIQSIVNMVLAGNHAGVDLNWEGFLGEDKPLLNTFIADLSIALHLAGKQLIVTVCPKLSEPGLWGCPQSQDYAVIGQHADYVRSMCYDGEHERSLPISEVRDLMTYTTSLIPKEKVILGFPFFDATPEYLGQICQVVKDLGVEGACGWTLSYNQPEHADFTRIAEEFPIATDEPNGGETMSFMNDLGVSVKVVELIITVVDGDTTIVANGETFTGEPGKKYVLRPE